MTESAELRRSIVQLFGEEAYERVRLQRSKANGEEPSPIPHHADNFTATYVLNRAYLAGKVFHDPAALEQLNALVHPAVAAHALAWHQQQTAPYTLHEAAITFETGGDRVLDGVIVVTAPPAIRLARVMHRDHTTAAEIQARMDKQWPEAKKVARADYVIYNYADQLLMPQVLRIHKALL